MLAQEEPAEEVVLETETDNVTALRFYRRLGFIKEKRMFRFYLNGKDAFRLKLPLEVGLSEEEKEQRRMRAQRDLERAVSVL